MMNVGLGGPQDPWKNIFNLRNEQAPLLPPGEPLISRGIFQAMPNVQQSNHHLPTEPR